jgi:DivIVA domain-containing protein
LTSQGQRFRRRALRRGYKVDEVDSFLDRVEATLAGDPIGAPVAAQEVHDVVFRVRFGGYDEWQVDLHLDRVERQLSELEERGGAYPRGMEARPAERMPPQERMMPERMAPPPPPMREERIPPLGPPQPMPGRPGAPMPPPGGGPGYGRYDEPTYAGQGGDYEGFDPGRHGKDMTSEIRMPEGGLGGPPPMGPPPMGGGPMGGPPPMPMGAPPMGGLGAPAGEAQRIDQLRRTFQLRRFGSGYDRAQVDRLFDMLITAMSGRSAVAVGESELDPSQFNLVPGGYFEAEVDAALKEVRDMLSRRR